MNQASATRGKGGKGKKTGYFESEPDVTSTGVGKNYNGYRIFHYRDGTGIEIIDNEYTRRAANAEEILRFKKDLAKAALTMPAIAAYIESYPELKLQEPMAEGPLGLAGNGGPAANQ